MCWMADLMHVQAPEEEEEVEEEVEEESCDSLRKKEKEETSSLFSVKGHVDLNCFHVASVSVDLRSEVATDNNANKTHSS